MRLHHYTITEHNGATLRREGADYVMRSPGSAHRLLVSATSVERLTIHWQGFSGWKGETFEIAGAGRAARKANREGSNAISERIAAMSDSELFEMRTAQGFKGARGFVCVPSGLAGTEYMDRVKANLRRTIGRIITTRPGCGWSRFVVVGIARDGARFRVRRLRTGSGTLNETITLIHPSKTDVGPLVG